MESCARGRVSKDLKQNNIDLKLQKIINSYPWYKVPPPIHKVLIHGSDIVAKSLEILILLSEEGKRPTKKLLEKLEISGKLQLTAQGII